MSPSLLLALIVGCGAEEEPVDLRDPPVVLEVPEVGEDTLNTSIVSALELALTVDARRVWPVHADTLDLASPGCPNFYAGPADLDSNEMPEDGWSWFDLCDGPGGRRFAGWAGWSSDVSVSGDATTSVGATSEGTRTLTGDSVVALDDEVVFDFDGEASDSVLSVQADTWSSWSHSTRINGSMGGTWLDDVAPGGLRAEVFTRSTGGDADTLEIRGNVHLFEHRIAERFDSITMDLLWAAPGSTPPDACADEPRGWIGIRDEDAVWYELVYQPRYDDDVTDSPYENDPLNRCDGCAAVYVRGIRQEFDLCPDLSFVWAGALSAPDPASFTLDVRDILAD